MGFASASDKIWPITPDWTNGVQERLAWGTEILRASGTAVSQHRSWRDLPRRVFDFETAEPKQKRRIVEMLLGGYGGTWQLPIWPDAQWLSAPLAAGAVSVPCATTGFDFVEGGKALLYTSPNVWEVVQVDAIATDHLGLLAATTGSFGPGSRLYPLRRARLLPGVQAQLRTDEYSRRRLSFEIAEACDWPSLASGTEYLAHPVLDQRPNWNNDQTTGVSRLEQAVDYGTNTPIVHDLPGVALRAQQSHWRLVGRERHTWFRSLLYTLCGRLTPIWVPSFASDLKPAYTVAGGSTTLSVEWAGYTLFGKDKHNRKDVRIELNDGAVLYRRIVDATNTGDTEALTLSSALDAASIAPERIRAISFMALSTLGSDETEIDHETDADGRAKATTGWQAVVPDV